jgi:hypothetical protein
LPSVRLWRGNIGDANALAAFQPEGIAFGHSVDAAGVLADDA